MLSGVFCAVLLALPAADEPQQRYEFAQIHMGVPFTFQFYAPNQAAATDAARAAFRRIKQLNGMLSDYDPDSELMRLSRTSGSGQAVEVSEELLYLLKRSKELWKKSGGAFDVTVGPAVRLWRKARRSGELPDRRELAEARRAVGSQYMKIDPDAGTVELMQPGMQLDLGGIAQGYAADEALRILKEHGITRALIDASGDIVVGDPPPGRDAWRIAVEPLARNEQDTAPVLLLTNAAVTTSGSAYQNVEIDGVRYSHIIDPQTGVGMTAPNSTTVIAPDGTTADSLASAVSVLGPEKGLKLIEQTDGTAARIERVEDGRPVVDESAGFAKFLAPADGDEESLPGD